MIECNGKGLKQAIEDALKMMDEEGTQGFDYPIGEVRGMPIRIVCEPERGAFETTVFKGELHYSAVYEA